MVLRDYAKKAFIATGIDIGQLSGIERGVCRYKSKNLTKYCKYPLVSDDDIKQFVDLLLTRIETLIRRVAQHAVLFSKLVMVTEEPAA